VRRQIHHLGLDDVVMVHGFVPEDALEAALAAAHLAVNLRYPTMGEASVSQLQLFDHALPTLVTQIGWYAGLPEDAVAFVRPEREIVDIRAHLQAFLADPAHYARMGERGRRFLETEHRPEDYAQAIADFATAAAGWRPNAVLRTMQKRVSMELRMWMTVPRSSLAMASSLPDKWGPDLGGVAPRHVKRLERPHAATFRMIQERVMQQAERMDHEQEATLQAIRQVVAEGIGRWERQETEGDG
jgi:hypothetical protein